MIWDGSFVLLRPLTMEGGPYSHYFEPYKLCKSDEQAAELESKNRAA